MIDLALSDDIELTDVVTASGGPAFEYIFTGRGVCSKQIEVPQR
jgi:hypothetical protein